MVHFRHTICIAMATICVCGCSSDSSSKTNSGFQLSNHDGTYITSTNAQGVIAVVQVKYVAALGESAIFGYTVSSLDDAKTIAASGIPYQDAVTGGITTGIVRGELAYAESATPHTGDLTFTMQIKPNGTHTWYGVSSVIGPGYFNAATGALIESAPATSTTASTWTPYTTQ